MARYRLTIAYDGTDFHGWQKQWFKGSGAPEEAGSSFLPGSPRVAGPPDDQGRVPLRTVQHVVEQAVREVLREPVDVLGASRTDAGVHAKFQTAAFTTGDDRRGPPDERMAQAINSRLPDDVLVTEAQKVGDDFDPIRDCTSKGYSYSIHTGRERPLWNRRYVHHEWVELDDCAVAKAAPLFVGEHDFAAFAAAGHGRESTIRTVYDCSARRVDERLIVIRISGNGFLYNMVRIIAGTLVEVGKGRMTMEDVAAALQSGDRRQAGPTLPPEGLCLEWARFKGDPEVV